MKAGALAVAALLFQPAHDAVLAKLDAYLTGYEPKLSELIADEAMFQEVTGVPLPARAPGSEILVGGKGIARRRLRSEVAFIALPHDAGWLGFRHVKTVDQRALDSDRSLTTELSVEGFDGARTLLEASAAHNLGLPRTINLPNLPLEFLHRRNRHRLVPRFDGYERIAGVTAARVVFHERITPTLIRDPQGGDMPSTLRAWIDPSNGRLLRATVMTFKYAQAPNFENSVEVDFEHDRKIGLLVPKQMRETFPGDPGRGTSSANYSNYRRFQTSARIVPQ